MERNNNYKDSYFSNDLDRQNQANKGKNIEFKYCKWTCEANDRCKNGNNPIRRKRWGKRLDRKRASFHHSSYLDSFKNYDSDIGDIGTHDGYFLGINSDNFREGRTPFMINKQSSYFTDNWENEYQKDYHHFYSNQMHWMNSKWIYDEPFPNENRDNFYDEEIFVKSSFKQPNFAPYYNNHKNPTSSQDDVLIESKEFQDRDPKDFIRDKSFVEEAIINVDMIPAGLQPTLLAGKVIPQSDATIIPNVCINNNSGTKTIINSELVHDRTLNSFESLFTKNFTNINSGMISEGNTSLGPVKNIISLSKSVLYPPNPKVSSPLVGNKPLGCKSVLVKGLPEKATKKIIKEVFDQCGEILSIHINDDDNYCHIKFSDEAFVEKAIYFSGYTIRIENRKEHPFRGQLHVDYFSSNEDLYEYKRSNDSKECLPETPVREKKLTQPVVYYSKQEALNIGEKLRGEETFHKAMSTLNFWLERGECNKKNAASFYSMIQSTYSHILRLKKEQFQGANELNRAKLLLKQRTEGNLLKITAINKIFDKACFQKSWAHFTKPQRKKIKFWKERLEKIKNTHVEEMLNERVEDDMDVSDGDDEIVNLSTTFEEENSKLIEENNYLHYKLEVTQNEMKALQSELKAKDKYISLLREQLQSKST